MNVAKDFPVLKNNPKLTYLDSTATSLKPQVVIDAISEYYTHYSANIHRGLYQLSEKASEEYETTREVVRKFINAPDQDEIIFTRNTTESINIIMRSLGEHILDPGDEIAVTIAEHHANFVPWQQLALKTDSAFKIIDVDENEDLDIYEDDNKTINLEGIITKKTWILAINYISNVLGIIQPIKEIIAAARKINPKIIIIVDAAQAAPHVKIDVQDIDCDFCAFSSHKMCGPTGVGILWGRKRFLKEMDPFLYGGDMIREVYIDHTVFEEPPGRFEAGTPHIAGVIGLKAAIAYLEGYGMKKIFQHEEKLGQYMTDLLYKEFGEDITILGTESKLPRVGIAAFVLKNCHPHDVAGILDEEGVAVRAGNHCAMPLHNRLGIHATTRASLYMYNTEKDVHNLIRALKKVRKMLS